VPGEGEIVLPLRRGEAIEGVVEGLGASRIAVVAHGERFWASTRADESGRFRLRGLPPGRYRLSAHAPSAPGATAQANAGETGVRLRLGE
jgi:hypothetical protein